MEDIKLVIFDLDGTLLNTLEDLCFCGNHILEKHGYPTHPLDAYRYFVGNGIMKLVERALPDDVKDPGLVTQIYEEFMEFYQVHKMDKTAPYEGITQLLSSLVQAGIKVAVASNKAHEAMDELMHHYFPGIAFSAILGKRANVPPKPAPDIIFDILQMAQVPAENTLYAGDTEVDMTTARNAGLKKVGVLWGFRPESELVAAGADFIVQSPMDIFALATKKNTP